MHLDGSKTEWSALLLGGSNLAYERESGFKSWFKTRLGYAPWFNSYVDGVVKMRIMERGAALRMSGWRVGNYLHETALMADSEEGSTSCVMGGGMGEEEA